MAANIQNLPCKPGETHNPNGRPRKLSKVLKEIPPDAQQKRYIAAIGFLRLESIKFVSDNLNLKQYNKLLSHETICG